jgi:2-C-methyl-D-erythritol 2,4-cyclodiphosphate synthase
MIRVGMGYDVHRFAENRKLYLGGVEIDHDRGLDGHSDADVLIHAIADAILGAIGEADIGFHFPNDDPQWKDIRSTVFLEKIREMLDHRGAMLSNIDASLVAEEPKILPHLDAMKSALASALGIETGQVGIKATTNETMGFVGRGEGIAAMAVACVQFSPASNA